MSTKESYQISAQTMQALVTSLNRVLGRISDRLDKIEGLRGELETQGATFEGDVILSNVDLTVNDEDGVKVHSMQ